MELDSDTPLVTINYRRLNPVTVSERFPLPTTKDSLDALSGSVLFTTVDVSVLYVVLFIVLEPLWVGPRQDGVCDPAKVNLHLPECSWATVAVRVVLLA